MKRFKEYTSIWFLLVIMFLSGVACKTEPKSLPEVTGESVPVQTVIPVDYDTSKWKELREEDGYIIDIKYATTDNFAKEIIYPCARFFLKPEVAMALEEVRKDLVSKGYKIKLFDGYRPLPAQQKLWDKVPNPDYVAPPAEGSMHNRGVAIDLTITDMNGKEIDMGTPYDFFGPKAHQDYTDLPSDILYNRLLLKNAMEAHHFQAIRTEWWHYSYMLGSNPLDDWQWPCKN